jgi:hypothetical protein
MLQWEMNEMSRDNNQPMGLEVCDLMMLTKAVEVVSDVDVIDRYEQYNTTIDFGDWMLPRT